MKKCMFAILLSCSLAVSAFASDCGEKTNETLASSSEWGIIDGGKVSSLRGKVFYPDGKEAELLIVEVYRNDLSTPLSELTFNQIEEIVKKGRIAAVDTGMHGKFCFKNLKAGNYMLRANLSGERLSISSFKLMNIFVTLVEKRGKGVARELKVELELAI